MPRLPGLQVKNEAVASQLSFNDRSEIARALARMLIEVQSLTWECAGKYDIETGTVKAFEKHYREWIIDSIRSKLAAAQSFNTHTTRSDVDWIEGVIDKAKLILRLPYKICLVVGDYGEHNTVVLKSEGKWNVSGLFDLMTAHFGDGESDLSLQVTAYLKENELLADAFVSEYLRLKPVSPSFVDQQQLYMLDLKMSFWHYWQRQQNGIPGESESLSFEQWARPSVDYWNKYMR
jgi:aminoglycoside phosphotransferase (APT) family kinase protein